MPSRHYADAGYEPWARAAVQRRAPLTVEQGEDLIATIDHLRGLLDQQDEQVRGLMGEAARLRAENERVSTNCHLMAEQVETTGKHAAALCEALDLSHETETDVAVAEIKRLRAIDERAREVVDDAPSGPIGATESAIGRYILNGV